MEERLISKVRDHPALYDTRSVKYRDQNVRNEAWEEIGASFHVPAAQCKETWGKLRNCFSNAIKRRRFKRIGYRGRKITPWKYESQMAFLLPFLEGKATQGGSESGEKKPFPPEEDASLQSDPHSATSPIAVEARELPKIERPAAKAQKPDDYAQDTMQTLQQGAGEKWEWHSPKQSGPVEMDEVDMFYLSMAKIIKCLPKIDQAKIRMEICRIVTESEIQQIELNPASRPSSAASQF